MDLVGLKAFFRSVLMVVALCSYGRVTHAQFFSPGPLAAPHGHLNGDDHCNDCHTAGKQVQNSKCTNCHDDVGRSVARGTGLHGRNYKGQNCGGCHVDHRGSGSRLIRWNPQTFDHKLTGWELRQEHAGVDCKTCHNRTNKRGARTYLGLSSNCTSCHSDPHQNRFGDNCLKCHDQGGWSVPSLDEFDHNQARFKLRGAHQKVECANCHGSPPRYEVAFLSCGNCHKDPHSGRFGTVCVDCHSEEKWTKIDMKRAAHPRLSLFGGHQKASCKQCHDRGLLRSPSRGGRCVGCHAQVHEAPFGDNCAKCHLGIRWLGLPDRIGRRSHKLTPFPLRGLHAKVKCEACHTPKLPQAKRYRGLSSSRCSDCHDDVHKGEFASRDNGECRPCHTEDGFSPTEFGLELHATTKFGLEGKHQAVPCGTCHDNLKQRERLSWRQPKQACAECHKNPHGDQFEREMAQGGCAHCHSPLAWEQPKIDHDTWPLIGAHASARCDQCHSPTEEDRKAGRGTSYRAAPRECEGCHSDAHLGQFRLTKPVRGCGECHNAWKFKLPDFDHKDNTGYRLQGKHAQLECQACHLKQELSDGQAALLYRLPYNSCKECHADPHAPQLSMGLR